MLPYEFLLEQNPSGDYKPTEPVLLPYEFLLEQNMMWLKNGIKTVLLPYEFLLEQNKTPAPLVANMCFVTI